MSEPINEKAFGKDSFKASEDAEPSNSSLGKLGGLLLSHIQPNIFEGKVTFEREGPAEKPINEDVFFKEPKFGLKKLHLDSRLVDKKVSFNTHVDGDTVSLTKINGIRIKMQLLGEVPLREVCFQDEGGQRVMSTKLELPLWAQVAMRKKYYPYKVTLSQSKDSPESKLMKAYMEAQKLATEPADRK